MKKFIILGMMVASQPLNHSGDISRTIVRFLRPTVQDFRDKADRRYEMALKRTMASLDLDSKTFDAHVKRIAAQKGTVDIKDVDTKQSLTPKQIASLPIPF